MREVSITTKKHKTEFGSLDGNEGHGGERSVLEVRLDVVSYAQCELNLKGTHMKEQTSGNNSIEELDGLQTERAKMRSKKRFRESFAKLGGGTESS